MEQGITVNIILQVILARFLLVVGLNIPVAVNNEQADIPYIKIGTLLYPYELPVFIQRLHAVTIDRNSELRAIRYGVCSGLHHFKFFIVQVIPVSGGGSKEADMHRDHTTMRLKA